MIGPTLSVGFMPLVDAAPVIVAHELGFAEQEGISLDLVKAPSWATLRDMLVMGRIEAAHMLAPVPVAMALGLGPDTRIDALSVLSVNGTVIGVSRTLSDKLRASGYTFDFQDATAAGNALIAASEGPLRIGVPFPFSMHAELLYYWLSALGLPAPQAMQIKTVPPPLMAEAMAEGEIDAFCVGEPWGSIAVENGVGELLLPSAAIWGFAPEKVLAVRHEFAQSERGLAERLIRAMLRAGRWLDVPENQMTASEILARPEYVNVSSEIIDRSFEGQLVISGRGEVRQVRNFVAFNRGAASFPWRSGAAWIGNQLAARLGLDQKASIELAQSVFRTDIYRDALRSESIELPRASSKVEGAVNVQTEVAADVGRLILEAGAFFDGRVFDPEAPN